MRPLVGKHLCTYKNKTNNPLYRNSRWPCSKAIPLHARTHHFNSELFGAEHLMVEDDAP